MASKIGQWAFVGGVVVALLLGFVPQWQGQLTLLLVVLGLIIGFNKLRSSDDENKKEAQTYY